MFSLLREPNKEEKKMKSKMKEAPTKENKSKEVKGNLGDRAADVSAVYVTRGNVVTALAAHAAELGAVGMGNTTEATHVKESLHFFGKITNAKQGR
jgi:S-adenosylmethionine synthetase